MLSSVLALTVASLKMYFRNFTAIFFTFVFPIIFLVVFGFINSNDNLTLNVAYINRSTTQLSESFDKSLNELVIDQSGDSEANEGRIFKVDELATTEDSAREKLAKGDLNAAIIVPEDFGKVGAQGAAGEVQVLIDQANASFGEVTTSAVSGILTQLNVEASVAQTGQPPITPFQVKTSGVQSDNLKAIDYLVPGIIGFSIMSLGVFSITEGFIQLKTNGALRRLKVTPISPLNFLVAQSLTRLVMTVINVLTMVLIGIFAFGFKLNGDIFSFLALAILGIIMFLGFGYGIAGWAKDGNQAAPLSNIIFFPMMFLSGTFFPRETFPDWLQPVTNFMPLTYLADGLREIANNGATLSDLGPQLLGMAVWTFIIYLVAVKLFRWE